VGDNLRASSGYGTFRLPVYTAHSIGWITYRPRSYLWSLFTSVYQSLQGRNNASKCTRPQLWPFGCLSRKAWFHHSLAQNKNLTNF